MIAGSNLEAAEGLLARMRSLLDELLAAPKSPWAPGAAPAKPGIYLFSDGERYRYVGQTRNLRARLSQHTHPRGTHYSATLAFLIAVGTAQARGFMTKGLVRAALAKHEGFEPSFAEAKALVASWDIQFIEVADPLVRTVFEVYVHVALGTDWNSFETH